MEQRRPPQRPAVQIPSGSFGERGREIERKKEREREIFLYVHIQIELYIHMNK